MSRVRTADAVVVGGGPAGMVAARDLARMGADVVLLDEHPRLGGQYYKRRSGAVLEQSGDLRPRGTRLAAAVTEAGVHVCSGTSVWGVDDDGDTLLTVRDGEPGAVRGRIIVLATGAHERVLPLPGWQLPGVVTPGAALHLATIDRVPVGRRVVVAGSGPFLLPVATALLGVGVTVVAVCEAATPYRINTDALRALAHPARALQFAGYRARLAVAQVQVLQDTRVSAVLGDDRVAGVRIVNGSGVREWAVDAVALGWGFRPNTEIAALLGCRTVVDQVTGDRRIDVDEFGRPSRADVLLAGEVAGVAGVHVALARGANAAVCAADQLRLHADRASRRRVTRTLRAANRAAAWTAGRYPDGPWPWLGHLDDDTVVCRCELVTAGELRDAAQSVVAQADPDAAKGATRAGMGPCQSRQCAPAIAALVGPSAEAFPARMPVRPVTVSVVAASAAPDQPEKNPPRGPADTAPATLAVPVRGSRP